MLAGAIFVLMSFAFGGGLVMIGGGATTDARAQLAADAAALAAVAESGPGGSGLPETAARRYAEMNGAWVVECICNTGASGMQVTVAIGDVAATARAEIDPLAFAPARRP
jgi:hypothetical protein